MVKVPAKLRLGKKLEGDANLLQRQLDDAYLDLAPAVNSKAGMVIKDRDPTTSDNNSDLGTIWLNSSTGNKWILTATTPTWTAF
jgi:hypothetical protein